MMMTRALFLVVALLRLSAAPASMPAPQSDPAVVAVLIRVESRVQLTSGSVRQDLTKTDVGRVLHAGDVLTCTTAASSFTLLNAAFKPIESTAKCSDGYRLQTAAG